MFNPGGLCLTKTELKAFWGFIAFSSRTNSFVKKSQDIKTTTLEISIEDLRPYLESLSEQQKDKLLHQLLKKNKIMIEQLYFKHVSTPDELDTRYDHFVDMMKANLFTIYRSRSDELAVAKAIGEAKKVINEFTRVDKRPEKEAELLMIILKAVFDDQDNPARFGTCWTKYDLTVAQTLKRLITIIKKKLHEDYLFDYKREIDRYLVRLKATSNFNDFVYELPKELTQ